MSRTAASYSMTWTRGSTAEEEFTYQDENGLPIDLTGFEARMQVRTLAGQYGSTTSATLLLELTTQNGKLVWDTAANGRLLMTASELDTKLLNPSNVKKLKLAYAIEVYRPAVAPATDDYVIPLVGGKITLLGETVR